MSDPHAKDVRRIDAALRQPDDERHLDAATELFPFVDGTADAVTRELVTAHVEECAMCRTELDDLLTLRGSMDRAARPGRNRLRAFALAATIVLAFGTLLVWLVRRPYTRPGPQPPVVEAPRPQPPAAPRAVPPPVRRAEWQRLVDETLARGSLPVAPVVATVALSGHELRGPEAHAASGVAPAGVVIEDDRPALRWKPVDGATYAVMIYESEREVAASGPLRRPAWTPPRLPRGKTYLWQVKVTRGDEVSILPAPPEPPALFHVLGPEAVRELAEARAAHPDDHLLLAVLSARHGLVAAAREHLDQVPPGVRPRISP